MFSQDHDHSDKPLRDALIASAVRDIPCPANKVGVVSDRRDFLVAGCGYIVTYDLKGWVDPAPITLLSRVQVASDAVGAP